MSRVLLLHSDAKVSQRLSMALRAASPLQVQRVASSVAQAREALAKYLPDLLVADLLQPGGNLLALLQGLRASGSEGRGDRHSCQSLPNRCCAANR